jgi:hypothetical protein
MANQRSPLKGRPLHNPGQSLDEQIRDTVGDYILWPVLVALFWGFWAVMEWVRYFRPYPPNPQVFMGIAVFATMFAAYRLIKGWPRLQALRLGRDGEEVVGQFLEALRERGYRVFHDVVGDGFNVDHILIGPAGVFTVETKTHSKPGGDARIVFDGETIRLDSLEPDRDPLIQAKAQAGWLRALLSESTGRKFEVRSVIVYPGWFVENTGPKQRSVWVVNPKALPTFLDHEPNALTPEDVKLASFHLSRFIRVAAC